VRCPWTRSGVGLEIGGKVYLEFGWSERTAPNFMGVAQCFGKSAKFADLPIQPSAAYLLAAPSAPDEARRTTLEMAWEGEQITTKMARKIVAKARKRKTKTAKPVPPDKGTSGSPIFI
jgi:hypothetical protein